MNTKTKILQKSIILFASHGYEGTSLSLIAQHIGISKPSLYAHYKSKQDLFEACLNEITQKQEEITNEILTDSSITLCEDKLYKLLSDCSKKVGKSYYSFYYRYLYFPPEEISGIINERIKQTADKSNSLIIKTITDGINNGEISKDFTIDQVMASYTCIMDGLSCNTDSFKNLDSIWTIFWNGVSKK